MSEKCAEVGVGNAGLTSVSPDVRENDLRRLSWASTSAACSAANDQNQTSDEKRQRRSIITASAPPAMTFPSKMPSKRLTVGSPITTGGSLSLTLWLWLLDLSGRRGIECVLDSSRGGLSGRWALR